MKIVKKIKNENKNENIFWKLEEKLKLKIDERYRLDNWGRPNSVGIIKNPVLIAKKKIKCKTFRRA